MLLNSDWWKDIYEICDYLEFGSRFCDINAVNLNYYQQHCSFFVLCVQVSSSFITNRSLLCYDCGLQIIFTNSSMWCNISFIFVTQLLGCWKSSDGVPLADKWGLITSLDISGQVSLPLQTHQRPSFWGALGQHPTQTSFSGHGPPTG